MPKFSLIIPVYNTEKYLRGTLDSIRVQSYEDFEVIIIDDSSKDNSLDIAKEYESKDSRFHVHSIIHGGLSIARNNGITLATGDYTIFIDSDDLVSPDLLSEVSKIIDRDDYPDVIKFSASVETTTEESNQVPSNHIAPELSRVSGFKALENFLDDGCSFSTAWGYAIRTDFLKHNNLKFAPGKICEGFRFGPEILLKAKSVSSTSFIGYHFIQREESISYNTEPEFEYKKALDCIAHYDNLEALIRTSDIPDNLENRFWLYLRAQMVSWLKRLSEDHKENYVSMLRLRNLFWKKRGLL